ncbi:hypothetical protein EDB86DRAFT_3090942 [Lactarius hatsudake]|nr:hypothetical protein EDB86DRAFT_3090942 [Lactarius hatsudake]
MDDETSVPATRRTPLRTAGVWTVNFLATLREVMVTVFFSTVMVNSLATLREVAGTVGLPRSRGGRCTRRRDFLAREDGLSLMLRSPGSFSRLD